MQAVISSLYATEHARSRYIRLTIHPDAETLRTAAHRYKRSESGVTEAVGLFQPAPFRSRYDRHTRLWVDSSSACAGVMRLAATHLTSEIIAHESTHAALHIWRLHRWSTEVDSTAADLGDYCGDTEEQFAYLLGGIVCEVSKVAGIAP